MKEVIKNIFKITLFIISFIIVFTVLTYMKKPSSIDLKIITGFYAEEEDSLDMVYIGGSAAFVFWEPLEAYKNYGIVSYDFGANTIPAEMYEYMSKEVLSRQNPELLVIDARAFEYRDYNYPSSVAYRNILTGTPLNKNKIDFIENNVPKYLNEETKSYYFDLFLYHTSEYNQGLHDVFNMILKKNEYDLKGFYFVPKAMRMQRQSFRTDSVNQVSQETTDILNDLISYLKTKDVEVLFVVSPYIELTREKERFNYIEKIIEESGFDFIDANEYYKEMKINYDTDFYDYNHMNIYGAEKYTDFLSKYIQENYNLPDRREDEEYSEWNLLLDNWNSLVEETKRSNG